VKPVSSPANRDRVGRSSGSATTATSIVISGVVAL